VNISLSTEIGSQGIGTPPIPPVLEAIQADFGSGLEDIEADFGSGLEAIEAQF